MSYTMEDFERDYIKEHFPRLTPEEQRAALERLSPERRRELLQALPAAERLAGLPAEERLASLSTEEIRQLLDQRTTGRPTEPRKPRRKK